MIRTFLAATLAAFALNAAAQSTPAANFTDMWFAPAESGWGVSFTQHEGTNQVVAAWYTYDPRLNAGNGRSGPVWLIMTGGTWVNPTTITGTAYVFSGVPFNLSGSNPRSNAVGTFTFSFTDSQHGTFLYDIAAPAGLAPTDPAYNLPAMSGSKNIVRMGY